MSANDEATRRPAWLASVPGYAGYAAKEDRRQADRAVREELARRLTLSVQSLQRLSATLATARAYADLAAVDQAASRIQHLVDRLRSVSEGYRGLFDQDQVDEAVLDQVLAFDRALARGVDDIGGLAVALAADGASAVISSADGVALVATTERLHAQLDARAELFSSGRALAPEAALAVLAERPAPASALSLKRGDAVSARDVDYIVDAVITYSGQRTWAEYRLRDGADERWLLVDGSTAAMLTPVVGQEVSLGQADEAQVAGRTYRLQAHGTAAAALDGPGGARPGTPVAYGNYHGPDDALLIVRDWGDERTMATGDLLDPALFTVYPRS